MTNNKQINVLIVDDSALVRQTMKKVLESDPSIVVCGQAADPIIAMRKMESVIPDVILLDIEMPRMNGLEFLEKVMAENPIPVVICSSVAVEDAEDTVRAFELGAVEVITKSSLKVKQFLEDSSILFLDAVKSAALVKGKLKKRTKSDKSDIKKPPKKLVADGARKKAISEGPQGIKVREKLTADVILEKPTGLIFNRSSDKIIAIGSSTGGPESLQKILPEFPLDTPGIVLVQHMPSPYTAAFAKRLNQRCEIEVREAKNGDHVKPGLALIAPGDRHMLVQVKDGQSYVELVDGPLVSRHRPSVDVLFRSVARAVGGNAVGCIMTGMGDDGATGMKEMLDAGASTFAQDEETSIVFGMPMQAWKRGAAQELVPLDKIPEVLLKASSKGLTKANMPAKKA